MKAYAIVVSILLVAAVVAIYFAQKGGVPDRGDYFTDPMMRCVVVTNVASCGYGSGTYCVEYQMVVARGGFDAGLHVTPGRPFKKTVDEWKEESYQREKLDKSEAFRRCR